MRDAHLSVWAGCFPGVAATYQVRALPNGRFTFQLLRKQLCSQIHLHGLPVRTRAFLGSGVDGGLGHLAKMWQHVVLAGVSVLLICRRAAGGPQACRTGGARPFPRVPVIRHDSQRTCRWSSSATVHVKHCCNALSGGRGGERNREAWRQAAWGSYSSSSPRNHVDSPGQLSEYGRIPRRPAC